MTLNLDTQKLEAAIISEAADQVLNADDGQAFSRLLDGVRDNVDARIAKIFADRADAVIQEAIDKAIREGFEKEYNRVDIWGKREGPPTTIAKELERIVSNYWSEKVDKSGLPANSSYGSMTRAQYIMIQVCGDDFSRQMKETAVTVTGALKDGLRQQMGAHMDSLLDSLFKVRSLQDQGKVEKPY